MSVESNKPTDDTAELKQRLLEQQRIIALQADSLEYQQDKLKQIEKRLARSQADVALLSKDEGTRQHAFRDTIARQRTRIEVLEEQLADLQRDRFGKRSEKHHNPLQAGLMLFNEAEVIDDDPAEAEQPDTPEESEEAASPIQVGAHTRKKKAANISLPPDLPRVPCEHTLSDAEKTCDACGKLMPVIGVEVSEQLCVIPQQHFVIENRREKVACECKDCARTARAPKQPIPGSQASARLLAWIMVRKYQEGLPLYRQEKIAARDGLVLPRYKLARWMIEGSKVFSTFIDLLEEAFFSYDIAQSDDTGIQVLKEDGRQAQSQSALWIRRGGPPDKSVVLVDYHTSKSGETCYQLLSRFRGYLVSDGAQSFSKVVDRNKLSPVLCNDHARRRFDKILNNKSSATARTTIARRAITYYGKLYRIEREIKSLTAKEKYVQRQQQAKPIWGEFLQWATRTLTEGVAHGRTTRALEYLINHREGLQGYLQDGRLPISNILAEHVAKAIAIPRKNFLFSDTPQGAHASARIFSVIETARTHGHHSWKYLSVLLTELPNAQTRSEIESWLPWNVTPQKIDAIFETYPVPK